MTSSNTLLKKIIGVKDVVVTDAEIYSDHDGVTHLTIDARPNSWNRNKCPFCGRKKLPGYDRPSQSLRVWRGLDLGGVMVDIRSQTNRIICPEHGVVTADVPWAYPNSGFTKDFDMTVSWLAKYLPRSTVSEYMRIDWKTVGKCISRSLHDLEPDLSRRLDGLVHIGIDETSYCKGYKYITVIVNHDTNTVVWAADGHGKAVLSKFYGQLTDKQKASIKVVTGDGARWITDCVNEFTPDCVRCVDPFHVVEWAMDALDELRSERWHKANDKVRELSKNKPKTKGRPKSDDKAAADVKAAKAEASEIKNSRFALGKAPENLTKNQQVKLAMIQANDRQLYRGYCLKEALRMIFKNTDADKAESELDHWLWWASHSRIPVFHDLYKKIKRHKEHILNTIKYGLSNARIEATNNKIKLIIRKAYGFRNIQNMLDMVYLVCSNIRIPLPNRKSRNR